ncbi:hypothetical protein ACFL35_03375 [Candidatus Riflebacteria bacterium]
MEECNNKLKENVFAMVFQAIDELNEQLPREQKLSKTQSECLYGNTSKLNSLGLVNFVVTTEQKIIEKTGKPITLVNEKAMSRKNSPFRTVETFVEYICELMQQTENETS